MSEVTCFFTNYTSDQVTLRADDGRDIPIRSGTYISNLSSTSDYFITYKRKEYKISREIINRLAPSPEYQFYITEHINVSDPTINSTFKHIDETRDMKWLPSNLSNIVYSPTQNLMVMNATSDKSWITYKYKSISVSWGLIIFFVSLILFIIVVLVIAAYFYHKKHKQ